jgi:hypothetical protein
MTGPEMEYGLSVTYDSQSKRPRATGQERRERDDRDGVENEESG